MNKQFTHAAVQVEKFDENRLYQLVFTGKITLKEYLQEQKRLALKKQAA